MFVVAVVVDDDDDDDAVALVDLLRIHSMDPSLSLTFANVSLTPSTIAFWCTD